MSTSVQPQVFGACQVWIGTGTGSPKLLQFLGYSEDGVTMRHTPRLVEMKVDVAGTELPADFQDMGEEADITIPLSWWSQAILDLWIKRGRSTKGAMIESGTPIGTNGNAISLALVPPSSSSRLPREYYTTILKGAPEEEKFGTRYSVLRLKVYAWPFIPPAQSTTLYRSPFATTNGAAVLSNAGAVLYVDGAISSGRFDSATI